MLASWKWIFRFLAIVAFASTGLCITLLPAGVGRNDAHLTPLETIKRLDLIGTFCITASLLLFILVSGASDQQRAKPRF